MKIKYIALFLVIILSGCASNPVSVFPSLNITFPEQNRIRFSGKGSGAGMMLMSSMGAMGVAVGVAIDEGIGKDIETTALKGDVSYSTKLEKAIEQWSATSGANSLYVVIERYGFITQPGQSDPITCDLKLKHSSDQENWTSINFPSEFDGKPTRPLALLKTDSQAINDLINECLNVVFSTAIK